MNSIGRYEIDYEISRTKLAVTYLAHSNENSDQFVIKVLGSESLNDPTIRARYQREVQIIGMLEHPAIVPVIEFGEQEEHPYIVMPYMEGGNLGDILAQGALTLEETLAIVERISSALSAVHPLGIIHGNIKPSNILFDQNGVPFLSDFGMVKLAEASLEADAQALLGPPAYFSPEQAKNEAELDGRSDVYMLGVLVFEMLTGQLPYFSETPIGYAVQHLTIPAPNILEYKPDLPPACQSIIYRALARDVNKRFGSIEEFAEAFSNLAEIPKHSPDTFIGAGLPKRLKPVIISDLQAENKEKLQKAIAKRKSVAWSIIGTLSLILALLVSVYGLGQIGQGPLAMRIALGNQLIQTLILSPTETQTLAPTPSVTSSATSTPQPSFTSTAPEPTLTLVPFTPTIAFVASLTPPAPLVISVPELFTTTYQVKHLDTFFGIAGLYQIDLDHFLKSISHSSCADRPTVNVQLPIPGYPERNLTYSPAEIYAWNINYLVPKKMTCMESAKRVAFSGDGRMLAVIKGKSVFIWRVGDWVPLFELIHPAAVRAVDFSPDGAVLVTGSDDTFVHMWSLASGEEIIQPLYNHMGPVTTVAFSPDGIYFATGSSNGSLILWSESGALFAQTPKRDTILSLAFSPDNEFMLAAGYPGSVRVFLNSRLSSSFDLNVSGTPIALAFSPDGMLLASNHDVWQINERRLLYSMNPLGDGVSFSRDSQLLAAGNQFFRISNGASVYSFSQMDAIKRELPVVDVKFSPQANSIALATRMNVFILGLQEGIDATPEPYRSYMVQPGDTIYTLSNLFDVSLEALMRVNGFACTSPIFISQHVFVPDAPEDALVKTQSTSRVIDAKSAKSLKNFRSFNMICNLVISGLAFTSDSRYLVGGSSFWNLETGAIEFQANEVPRQLGGKPVDVLESPIMDLSPDNKIAAVRLGNKIEFWSVSTGKKIRDFVSMESFIATLAFSPDGKYLAAASQMTGSFSGVNEVRVWNADNGELVWANPGIAVNRLYFASDSKTLILQGVGTVRVWRIGDNKPLYSLQGIEKELEISPDHSYMAFVTCENNARINNRCITETAQVIQILTQKASYQFQGRTSEIQNLEFLPDGKALAGSSGNGVIIWNLSGEVLHNLFVTDSRDQITNLDFSPIAPLLFATDVRGRLRIWDLETDTLVHTIADAKIDEMKITPDGKMLVTISKGIISLWGIPEE